MKGRDSMAPGTLSGGPAAADASEAYGPMERTNMFGVFTFKSIEINSYISTTSGGEG
jgi:hypothetical protein